MLNIATKLNQVICTVDVPNVNNRIYPRSVWEEIIDQHTGKWILGQVGMTTDVSFPADQASHAITNMRFDGNKVIGDVYVLPTSAGALLLELLQDNSDSVEFCTSGVGMIDTDGIIYDFNLIGIHACLDPDNYKEIK